MSAACFWLGFEPVREDGCVTVGSRGSRGYRSCDPGAAATTLMFGIGTGFSFAWIVVKLLLGVLEDLAKPLQTKRYSPALRSLVLFKNVLLEKVVLQNRVLDIELLWLDDHDQPQRRFALHLEDTEQFNYYPVSGGKRSAKCLFSDGMHLQIRRVKDLAGREYARVAVICPNNDCLPGELELETRKYSIQPLPL